MSEYYDAVDRHYSKSGLGEKILTALKDVGKDIDKLTQDDLSAFDQFHTGGLSATMGLANLAGLQQGARVLDVGCGIGGPARVLAAEFGSRVTGIDLSEEFYRTAEMLTARVSMRENVTFRHGDASNLPFDDETFDVVWTQNVLMNIEDKMRAFSEMHRVLRPAGRLALDAIMLGPVADMHFPVMWASGPELAFLMSPGELRRMIVESGFEEAVWDELAGVVRPSQAPSAEKEPLPIGVDILVDSDFQLKSANGRRNMEEERTTFVTGVFERI